MSLLHGIELALVALRSFAAGSFAPNGMLIMTNSLMSRRKLVGAGMALAGATLIRSRPARAVTKVRLLTNWFAEAEHGGFYQALATGLYEKAGLEVEIRQGNAQLNGMQLLLGGETDIIMSYDITILNALEKGAPIKAFFTSFQFDLIGLMTQPNVGSLAALKGPNLQAFFNDPDSAVAGYLTAEPFLALQRNVPVKFFLFAEQDYPPYANTMVTTTAYLKDNSDAVTRFTRASVEGWRDYLRDPSAANTLIKRLNPQMPEAHMAFSLQKMRDVKAVDGGDAAA